MFKKILRFLPLVAFGYILGAVFAWGVVSPVAAEVAATPKGYHPAPSVAQPAKSGCKSLGMIYALPNEESVSPHSKRSYKQYKCRYGHKRVYRAVGNTWAEGRKLNKLAREGSLEHGWNTLVCRKPDGRTVFFGIGYIYLDSVKNINRAEDAGFDKWTKRVADKTPNCRSYRHDRKQKCKYLGAVNNYGQPFDELNTDELFGHDNKFAEYSCKHGNGYRTFRTVGNTQAEHDVLTKLAREGYTGSGYATLTCINRQGNMSLIALAGLYLPKVKVNKNELFGWNDWAVNHANRQGDGNCQVYF